MRTVASTRLIVFGALFIAGGALCLWRRPLLHLTAFGAWGGGNQQTIASVLRRYGPATRRTFEPICRAQKVAWPPQRIYLLAFKQERRLEVWGANADGPYRRLAVYPIRAASGTLGPKRRQGDTQVPEGFYRLPVLNPNSAYHLSIRVDYPSADDVRHSPVPTNQMGGDIYVHGSNVSIGCLALGDPAIEEVFCLVAQARRGERRILIAPVDFRDPAAGARLPAPAEPWLSERYARLKTSLAAKFRR